MSGNRRVFPEDREAKFLKGICHLAALLGTGEQPLLYRGLQYTRRRTESLSLKLDLQNLIFLVYFQRAARNLANSLEKLKIERNVPIEILYLLKKMLPLC